MKKIFEKIKNVFEKQIIVTYVLISYVKFFFYALIASIIIFAVLFFSGLYSQMETSLNLKYNSPFVLVPLFGFLGLAIICLCIGFLMYFYKYKRSKIKGVFYRAFSNILDENKREEKQ